MQNYKVVSLFSGCGGMDLGFEGGFEYLGTKYKKNNFQVVFSNDIEKKACETYDFNFKNKSTCCDIEMYDESLIPECDVVIGGFPCQDFSLAGKRKGFDSKRGLLYKHMLRIVESKKPKVFIAENVEGISMVLNGNSPLDKIISEFRAIGYNVKHKVLNAADYGVPQTRKRVIIIGVRSDIKSEINHPEPTHKQENWITVKEAIDDLWDKIGSESIKNHTERDYSKAKFSDSGKGQGNRQLDPRKPSITIRAEHHGNIEGHYRSMNEKEPENRNYWRRLSVRECARIQSFPDDFIFPVASSSAYKQVGNAVPPVLAWHVARAVYEILEKA